MPAWVRDVSETLSPEPIARRLDGLQNSVSGVTRRMVTLESNLAHGTEAIADEVAGLQARVDQLAGRINALVLLRHSFCTTVLCGERPQQGHRGRA